jgi:tetratricopeptide (TPR) repeat protein
MRVRKWESDLSSASTDITRLRRWLLGVLAVAVSGCAGPAGVPEANAPVDGAAQGRYEQALSALADGDVVRAEAMLSALIREYPELDGPRLNLAILYAASGREAEAMVELQAVLDRDPHDAVAWNQIGILHRQAGDFPAADAAYLEALEAAPDYALTYRNRGVLLDLYLGQPGEALSHYERYLELSGSDPEVEKWVAELSLRLGLPASPRVAER